MTLNADERATLRRFLARAFSFTELKDLAFDLGVDFQLLSHNTAGEFARELIALFERKGELANLVAEVLRQRYDAELFQLLAALPTHPRACKMQIMVDNNLLNPVQMMLGDLAHKLKISESEIILQGADWGGVRLLREVPEDVDRIPIPTLDRQLTSSLVISDLPHRTLEIPRSLLLDDQDLFFDDPSSLYALKVVGDSFIDALVYDNDFVVIHGKGRVKDGDMAVVWLEKQGCNLLRKVFYEGEYMRLLPANSAIAPLVIPANEVLIQGKIVLIIRKSW
jgi:hypothetical protein